MSKFNIVKDKIKEKSPILYKIFNKIMDLRREIIYKRYLKVNPDEYQNLITSEYERILGKKLNWDNLQTYNEKMQWVKLYDNTSLKSDLSDKYKVRSWVEGIIGKEYLIPIYGVWDNFDEIDFSKLPKSFVLKTNHGSGTNFIVKDKNDMDIKKIKKIFSKWMNTNFAFYGGLELQYKNIKPKIIAEKYMIDSSGELNDYKFLCFDSEVYYCWVDEGRFEDHRRNMYDLNWKIQPWNQYFYANTKKPLTKPENFEEMIKLTRKLCRGFSHVRVDLYNVDGKIYFGEMTFTNGRGYEEIIPYEANLMLGRLWKLK